MSAWGPWCGSMPAYRPITEEVRLERPQRPRAQTAQFPPIEKLPDGRLIVNEWPLPYGETRKHCIAIVWTRADHPNHAMIPPGAPRVVRALYKTDGQLAFLRGDYDLAIRALDAWDEWLAANDINAAKELAKSPLDDEVFLGARRDIQLTPTGRIYRGSALVWRAEGDWR